MSRSATPAGTRCCGALPGARLLFLTLGTVALGLGVLGALLPLLPTTPFLLLAAACYARSSERLHLWLLSSRTFGPTLRSWREHRAVPVRARRAGLVLIVISFGLSLLLIEQEVARWLLVLVGLGLFVFMLRLPTRPGEEGRAAHSEQ